MTYTTFQSDLERGKEIEYVIDEYYADKFDRIETVTLDEEKNDGIDRRFFHNNKTFTVEYKADFASQKYGNVFIETSVKSINSTKDGWALKTEADVIMIYAGNGNSKGLYLIKKDILKTQIPFWKSDFKSKETIKSKKSGREWWAEGICVPLLEFGRYCFKFIPDKELRG